MIYVKYFSEEPAAFETGDEMPSEAAGYDALQEFLARPRLYRGYLSAADPDVGPAGRSGATAVGNPSAWAVPLVDALAQRSWWRVSAGAVAPVAEPVTSLLAASDVLLVAGAHAPDPAEMADAERQLGLPGPEGRLGRVRLARRGFVVCWREPALDGFDWAVLADRPLAEHVVTAFERVPDEDVRRFVIPFRDARSEHRFHFERYDPDLYARCEVGSR